MLVGKYPFGGLREEGEVKMSHGRGLGAWDNIEEMGEFLTKID